MLVRVYAASVNQADWIALTGRPYAARLAFGLVRPKLLIPGSAMAGRVAAVGRYITQFDAVDAFAADLSSETTVRHLARFLLTNLLLDQRKASAPGPHRHS